jgi:hypothetical protein
VLGFTEIGSKRLFFVWGGDDGLDDGLEDDLDAVRPAAAATDDLEGSVFLLLGSKFKRIDAPCPSGCCPCFWDDIIDSHRLSDPQYAHAHKTHTNGQRMPLADEIRARTSNG